MTWRYSYDVLCWAVPNHFSHVPLWVTPWTVAHQAPLSMGFSRQEYWRGLPSPPAGDLPNPGIKLRSLMSPALAADSLPLTPPGKPYSYVIKHLHRISATHHSYCCLTSLWYYPKFFSFNLFIHNPNSREFMCTHSYIHTDILFPKSCLSLLALWCICFSLWSSRSFIVWSYLFSIIA